MKCYQSISTCLNKCYRLAFDVLRHERWKKKISSVMSMANHPEWLCMVLILILSWINYYGNIGMRLDASYEKTNTPWIARAFEIHSFLLHICRSVRVMFLCNFNRMISSYRTRLANKGPTIIIGWNCVTFWFRECSLYLRHFHILAVIESLFWCDADAATCSQFVNMNVHVHPSYFIAIIPILTSSYSFIEKLIRANMLGLFRMHTLLMKQVNH